MGHDKFTSTSFTLCGGKEAANVEILSLRVRFLF